MPRISHFLEIGPFIVHVDTRLARVRRNLERCYEAQILPAPQPFADFHIRVDALVNARLVFRPQCQFWLDGKTIFKPLPLKQAPAFFEWGLNWCIGQTAHQFLQLHAAVIARDDRAALLVGAPGSGKSTLTAILALSGWRLLSDEFALLATDSGLVSPLPRPISLKDGSIVLIRKLAPDADLGTVMNDTRKGTVAHLRQPLAAVREMTRPAAPRWLVFPTYDPAARSELRPLGRGSAAIRAAEQAFNYSTLGRVGFETLADLVEKCDCYEFVHNDPDSSLRILNDLADRS